MNYFQNGQGDGTFILILALISLVLVLTQKYKGLWFTSLGSLGVTSFTFMQFQLRMSDLKEDMASQLGDDPFCDFLKRIESGTNTKGLYLGNGMAVKSKEFNQDFFFVSTEMQGPRLEGSGDIAVFNLSNSMIMSVNAVANEFFVLPDGRTSKLEVSITDDGVRGSTKCLE